MEANSPIASLYKTTSTAPWLQQRATVAYAALFCLVFSLVGLLVLFGLFFDVAEFLPAPESSFALELGVSTCLAWLLVSNFIVFRHFLLLLAFVKTLRAAFLRLLRNLLPPTPALCSAPRTIHGSRAPPLAG
ncbi:hypothetical protein BTA51_26750 [Hahella sp. CCB-MM4]|uniref:hypothetical protein n=1 Tax=Hahella sp. (strain CCB-MM4) TaxID=1926491 RepID=UPI000B9C63EC|nr:hypothetical protein [Hahella sp. CCB-MM4]OZG70320.1 hypothetical protein BTA51_26750 [Hahella sp. CCB-MM4]